MQTKNFLILTCIFGFWLLIFGFVEASTVYLLPQSQDVWQGSTFIAEVWLDTEGKTINSVQGYLSYPSDKLKVIDISEGGSILSLWLLPPAFSNEEGSVSFIGGVPNGFSGQARLFSITFGAIQSISQLDSADIYFQKNSRVLLHDGQGTFDSLSFGEASYRLFLKPDNLPVISSSSHPDENRWYQNNNFDLKWNLIEGTPYSYLLSQDAGALPDEIPDIPEGQLIWMGDMAYKGLGDGVYYFHLRQKMGGQWSPKITRRAMIDTTPPEQFQLEMTEIEGKNYLVFASLDNASGIDYYEAQEGERGWKKVQSPYLLEDQRISGKITVRVVDKAGNESVAEYSPPYPYKKSDWKRSVVAPLFLIGATAVLLLVKKARNRKPKATS